MKVFLVDSIPRTMLLCESPDYTTRLTLSATADTLFSYNREKNDVEKHAASEYRYSDFGKKLIVKLRNDLFFYNGEKVIANDYAEAIENLRQTGLQFGKYFADVSVSALNDEILQIEMPHANFFFHKYLSSINISPQKEGKTSGPYYIKEYERNQLILSRNDFYRTNEDMLNYEDISFRYSSNSEKDICDVLKGDCFCTCSTNLTQEQREESKGLVRINDSFIYVDLVWINLKYLQPKYYSFRKLIFESVDTRQLKLDKVLNKADSFICFVKSNNGQKQDRKITSKSQAIEFRKILLAYDDFYPNSIIADFIKRQIEGRTGITVELIRDDYYNPSGDYDLKVCLTVPDYYDKTAYLMSPKFMYYTKLDFIKSFSYRFYMKRLYKSKKDGEKFLRKMNGIIIDRCLRKRMFSIKHAFICTLSDNLIDFDCMVFDKFN